MYDEVSRCFEGEVDGTEEVIALLKPVDVVDM